MHNIVNLSPGFNMSFYMLRSSRPLEKTGAAVSSTIDFFAIGWKNLGSNANNLLIKAIRDQFI